MRHSYLRQNTHLRLPLLACTSCCSCSIKKNDGQTERWIFSTDCSIKVEQRFLSIIIYLPCVPLKITAVLRILPFGNSCPLCLRIHGDYLLAFTAGTAGCVSGRLCGLIHCRFSMSTGRWNDVAARFDDSNKSGGQSSVAVALKKWCWKKVRWLS